MVQRLLEPGEIEALDHTAIPRLLLPEARSLFTARAARLRQLANNQIKGIPVGETLAGYLNMMAALVDAQAAAIRSLPADTFTMPDAATIQLAIDHHMPPLPVSGQRLMRRPTSTLSAVSGLTLLSTSGSVSPT